MPVSPCIYTPSYPTLFQVSPWLCTFLTQSFPTPSSFVQSGVGLDESTFEQLPAHRDDEDACGGPLRSATPFGRPPLLLNQIQLPLDDRQWLSRLQERIGPLVSRVNGQRKELPTLACIAAAVEMCQISQLDLTNLCTKHGIVVETSRSNLALFGHLRELRDRIKTLALLEVLSSPRPTTTTTTTTTITTTTLATPLNLPVPFHQVLPESLALEAPQHSPTLLVSLQLRIQRSTTPPNLDNIAAALDMVLSDGALDVINACVRRRLEISQSRKESVEALRLRILQLEEPLDAKVEPEQVAQLRSLVKRSGVDKGASVAQAAAAIVACGPDLGVACDFVRFDCPHPHSFLTTPSS